jgi:hypothetical protein
MADYVISISVDSNGNFTHSPSALHVQSGDRVAWVSANPFVIQFQDGNPLDGNITMQAASQPIASDGTTYPYSISLKNVDGAASGNFHYSVAVYDTGTQLVRIDGGCPVIVAN